MSAMANSRTVTLGPGPGGDTKDVSALNLPLACPQRGHARVELAGGEFGGWGGGTHGVTLGRSGSRAVSVSLLCACWMEQVG